MLAIALLVVLVHVTKTAIGVINKNPFLVATYINDVFREFVFGFLLKTNVLGKITDYVIKVEFQQRGTPHIHLFLWVEGAPIYGVDSDGGNDRSN